MKKSNYLYYWHDQLINHQINPQEADLALLGDAQVEALREELVAKNQWALSEIKERYFKAREADENKEFIRKHYDELVGLMGKVYRHSRDTVAVSETVADLYEFVSLKLGHMLQVLETDYKTSLPSEVLVPITRLAPARDEIVAKMDMIVHNLSGGSHGHDPIYIVRELLDDFIRKVDVYEPVTLHEFNYVMYVVRDVEALSGQDKPMTSCPPLHELLIKWNLNSKTAISYFTHGIEEIIAKSPSEDEVMKFLQWEYKNLGQMPEAKGYIYNPAYPSLRDYCRDWVAVEIDFRIRNQGFVPLSETEKSVSFTGELFKIMVGLSSDQIALILRGLYDLHILSGRSLSFVFKTIVPFLSTPNKVDPSWSAMRAKSYDGEEPDKQLVISMLEKLIEKVKEY
ncbi:hypothetical protein MKQ68_18930 [Chitinophaga horti]|uniref:Uncharacterized protein n=1 Tax=Chitinophaga horti TaxID=2920382 RepID=A0ABY6IXP6_9BACT|nr:hypothetical protein [Chitinophaga horti]UYQ92165.1 hypothetical protein MKQ68_18930 [Chitinophaga horti]